MASDIRKAILNSALSGKAMSPDQVMSAMYGQMGGIFGKLQGNDGAMAASIQTPTPPSMPKPMIQGINILKYL